MKKCFIFFALLLGIFAIAGYFAVGALQNTPVYRLYKIQQVVTQVDKSAEEFHFTPEQLRILREIKDMILREGDNLNDGGGDILDQLAQEFKSDRFNAPKLNSLSGKLVLRIQNIMPDIYEKLGEFHATLTDIQKTKIAALFEGADQ